MSLIWLRMMDLWQKVNRKMDFGCAEDGPAVHTVNAQIAFSSLTEACWAIMPQPTGPANNLFIDSALG